MFFNRRLTHRKRSLTVEQLDNRSMLAVILVPEQQGTIQDAIDAAIPGDIISIRPGTYHEQVDIWKSLTLQGRTGRAGAVVITPGATDGDGIFVEPGVASVAICNLRVTGWEENGMQIGLFDEDPIDRVAIKNVIADFNGDDGIDIENAAVASLIAVWANKNDDDGVDAEDVGALTIQAGTFNDNDDHGVEVLDTDVVKLVGITALRNFDDGVFVEDDSFPTNTDVVILGGIFKSNGVLGGGLFGADDADGVHLVDVDDIYVSGIVASDNHEDGLDVDTALGNVTIIGGVFLTNGVAAEDDNADGVDIDSVDGKVTVTGIVAQKNFGEGLEVEFTGNVDITGGSFSYNGSTGILMEEVGDVRVTGVACIGNFGDGLAVFEAGFVTVKGSSFLKNADDGIDLEFVTGHLFIGVVSLLNGDENFAI